MSSPVSIDLNTALVIAGAIIAHPFAKSLAELALKAGAEALLSARPDLKDEAVVVAHIIEKAAGGDGE